MPAPFVLHAAVMSALVSFGPYTGIFPRDAAAEIFERVVRQAKKLGLSVQDLNVAAALRTADLGKVRAKGVTGHPMEGTERDGRVLRRTMRVNGRQVMEVMTSLEDGPDGSLIGARWRGLVIDPHQKAFWKKEWIITQKTSFTGPYLLPPILHLSSQLSDRQVAFLEREVAARSWTLK